MQIHHALLPNAKVGMIQPNWPCNIGGNAGFNWRIPAALPWTVAASDDLYIKIFKSSDPSENSEHLWTKPATFNILGCPSSTVCPTGAPTPNPTPFPTPPPPTPLPTDTNDSTTTSSHTTTTSTTASSKTTANSSGGSSTSAAGSSGVHDSDASSTSGSDVHTGVSGGASNSSAWTTLVVGPSNATNSSDVCFHWPDCISCHQQQACYWCGDDTDSFHGCRSIGIHGGFLGPSDPSTHIVSNLFANDGSTCQNWYYGQCAISGRALVFLTAGAIALVLTAICVGACVCCCCCKGKCGKRSKGDSDHVPLLSSMDDDEPPMRQPVVSATSQQEAEISSA